MVTETQRVPYFEEHLGKSANDQCTCKHRRLAHLTSGEYFFSYNCDCQRFTKAEGDHHA